MFKRAQISIFIIISVILVTSTIFLYSQYSNSKENELEYGSESLDLSDVSIKNYVQDCLDENAKLGIFYLADKGGYIYTYDYIF